MSSEETEAASPRLGVTPAGGEGTLGPWRAHPQHGGRAPNRPSAVCQEVGRGRGQTKGRWGVCAPALKLHLAWEGPWKKGQGFKPDLGNPAVRHYRGASGNVAVVDIFPRTAGAPEFYPNEPWPTWAMRSGAARLPTF